MNGSDSTSTPRMSWGFLGLVTLVVLVLDQLTKFLAVKHFTNLLQNVEGSARSSPCGCARGT